MFTLMGWNASLMDEAQQQLTNMSDVVIVEKISLRGEERGEEA